MVDSNKSFCLRLASITFPILGTKPAATAAAAPQQKARLSISQRALPATAAPTVREELAILFRSESVGADACLSSVENLARALEHRPDVQSRLSLITQYTPSKWLLERELEASGHWPVCPPNHNQPTHTIRNRADGTPDAYDAARRRAAVGLCLSGGGIRSATFNLGILQALSRHRRIGKLDYISSVSGGGYIHQFLANWIYRADSVSTVESLLDPIPNEPGSAPLGHRATVQPEPISWLRRYSNYLAPRRGVFSLDSWTIIAVWSRNTALNLVVLLSTLFFILLLPQYGTMLNRRIGVHHDVRYILAAVLLVSYVAIAVLLYKWLVDLQLPGPSPLAVKFTAAALFLASTFIAPAMYRLALPEMGSRSAIFAPITEPVELHYQSSYSRQSASSEVVNVSVDSRESEPVSRLRSNWSSRPQLLWVYFLSGKAPTQQNGEHYHIFLLVFLVLCALFLTAVAGAASKLPNIIVPVFFVFGLIVSYVLVEMVRLLFFVAAFAVSAHLIAPLGVVLLPTLIFGIPFITVEAGLGLIGRATDSAQREWLARSRAFSFLLGGGWLALSSFSLLGPSLFNHLARQAHAGYTVWLGWFVTSVGGVLSAKSRQTSHAAANSAETSTKTGVVLEYLVKIAPPVFISGLLVLIAKFADWSLHVSTGGETQQARFWLLALSSLAVAALFGWRVDINDFSMHTFYRDRLARCYGGATNPNRRPNRFTGFTRDDRDLRMDQLLPLGYTMRDERGHPALDDNGEPIVGKYKGPFPIICTSINLTMGEDLAYQERKASSFSFTPLFSGFNVGWTAASDARNQFNGFVSTRDYVYTREQGLMVATAVAISGAAASPNMGYHSSPAIAFLLTVFNVRLGWWLRNPRRRRIGLQSTESKLPPPEHDDPFAPPHPIPTPPRTPNPLPSSPRFGLLKLLTELLGRSNDTTSYVYLTDGGHFDNMGLYELLRRRCRTIIVCDGEADPHLHFEGMGMAIRKARLDFGVEVTLDETSPVPPRPDPPPPHHRHHPHQDHPAPSPGHEPALSGAGLAVPAVPTTGPAPSADLTPAPIPPSIREPAQDHELSSLKSTDPAAPLPQAEHQPTTDLPFVLSARISTTDSSEVTGTISRPQSPPPTIQGLCSFGEFPGNSIHCVHGTIRYPEDTHPDQFGRILYIKASLTGDEPPDLLNYRRQHQNFPHDTTLNQFFTESQFESYRRLGEHIVLTDQTAISWLDRYV